MVRLRYAQQQGVNIGFKGFNLNDDDENFFGITSLASNKSMLATMNQTTSSLLKNIKSK